MTVFAPIRMRETFMPPPVLPAQAPMNISSTSTSRDVWGHRSKSVVAKPVVVMMEATWNTTFVSASKTPRDILRMLKKTTADAPRITAR